MADRPNRPQLLDSTLREGEQTPGVRYRLEDKVAIARGLDAFGIDYLEVGHPAVSDDVFRASKAVANAGLSTHTLAHARALREDVDRARQCDVDWVGIFYSVRNEALEQRFRRDLDQVIATVQDVVGYAKECGLKVRYTPEDTVRSPWTNVRQVAQAAVAAGADRISIADTTGCMTPTRMAAQVERLRAVIDVPLHVHCHNDLGLAVANSMAAFDAGAQVADVTVNGIGERCGITDLASLATALRVAEQVEAPWDLTQLPVLAELVEAGSGLPVAWQAPVVGRYAFRHNAGLHVAAVFHDPGHYESIPAQLVGRIRSVTVGRFAGLVTLQYKCRELGIMADDATLGRVLRRIKESEVGDLPDAELLVLLAQEGIGVPPVVALA
ncbi:MAG TPA: homocitrate synthase [Candidatus Thermoplasmatota archaeon]|nr:homocitrate synthase [Candidatus Thermoplasmatota archaeon]